MRKQIVATKEGGAITGEERLREHTDTLYGAIMGYEGAPAAYQVERIGVLEAELASVNADFGALLDKDLPELNKALEPGGLPTIEPPPATAAVADSGLRSAGRAAATPTSLRYTRACRRRWWCSTDGAPRLAASWRGRGPALCRSTAVSGRSIAPFHLDSRKPTSRPDGT